MIEHSTIAENRSAEGHAAITARLYGNGNLHEVPLISHSIVTRNTTPTDGFAGLEILSASQPRIILRDTILAEAPPGFAEVSRVRVEPGSVVGPLDYGGGPTPTHAPLPGGPAIDAGDPGFFPGRFDPPLVHDQRGEGFDRLRSTAIDIGAVEAGGPTLRPGDYNGDLVVDRDDLTLFRRDYGSTSNVLRSDGNGDGVVNAADYVVWRDNHTPTQSADYNQNGEVERLDYAVWQSGYGHAGLDLPADGNRDGVVNTADYTIWRDAMADSASIARVVSVGLSVTGAGQPESPSQDYDSEARRAASDAAFALLYASSERAGAETTPLTTRLDSTSGSQAVAQRALLLLAHDGVRPFVINTKTADGGLLDTGSTLFDVTKHGDSTVGIESCVDSGMVYGDSPQIMTYPSQ